jgi:hypothetical protein
MDFSQTVGHHILWEMPHFLQKFENTFHLGILVALYIDVINGMLNWISILAIKVKQYWQIFA